MASTEAAVVRLVGWSAGRTTAGLGLLVDSGRVVTCAHVVNAALGRGQREQERPGESDLVQAEFPLLPGRPVRLARVVAWVPPPGRDGGGDVAGLELREAAPAGAAPARFAVAPPQPGTVLRAFGYPAEPARGGGMWVDVGLKGAVGGQLLQVESLTGQTVKAQPGYSGTPAWIPGTGEAAGLLQAAPFADEPERDAYLLPPMAIAQAWEEQFGYLLVPENPYRGLEPFTASHAAMFFGRDADIASLTSRVRRRPVTVVAGPSGAGKSSLLRAGLLPALERERRWSVALARPGADPWPRLAAALLRAQHGQQVTVTLEESQREVARLRREGLGPAARFLRSQDRPLLIVVDQFEELLASSPLDQDLLDLLLPSPEAADEAARIILALRSDFLPSLQSVPGFHTRLNERLYLLSPMTSDQTRLAVTCPAKALGVGFEQLLVDQILEDAAGGSLPLLEFTLTKLWETQHHKTLTFTGYRQMGGVHGALDQFAGESAALLTHAAPGALDRLLLKLVRTHGPAPGLTTRQRVFQEDLAAAEWEVLRSLADARLVVMDTDPADGRPHAELVHDSLINSWGRLRDLMADNADFLTWLARVRQRAAEGDPLPEARIAEARDWLDTRPGDVPDDIRRFITSSETAAEVSLRELRDARDRAEALRLAAAAELALRTARSPITVALALGMESILTKPTVEGDVALRHVLRLHLRTLAGHDYGDPVEAVAFSPDGVRVAIARGRFAQVFETATGTQVSRLHHHDSVMAVEFSPDGTWVATASRDRSARVFEAATGTEVSRLDHDDQVWAAAFSPDGTLVATASDDGSARVFEAAAGTEVSRLDHDHPVRAVAFSPDGARVATASRKRITGSCGSVRVFEAASGTEVSRLDHDDGVKAVAFSPDGTLVATASGRLYPGPEFGSARVFEAATGTDVSRLDHDHPVNAVAFSPDGARVATASEDFTARVFDAATGTELLRLNHDHQVNAVAFSPDGTRVATASGESIVGSGGSARVFEAATGTEVSRLDYAHQVVAVAFSPDGTWLATASGYVESGSVRVLEAGTAELSRLNHDEAVGAVAFSPDGTWVATASEDFTARVFEAATGTEVSRLNHDDPARAVAFSPDGTMVATASTDGSTRVFEAATGTEISRLDHDNAVNAVAFSPDGTMVATASTDGSARVFEAATGTELSRVDHDDQVWAVAFSPDGTMVATASGEPDPGNRRGSARVFEAATGTELSRVDHDTPVGAVAFSPDGTRVATASGFLIFGGSARVIEAATGTELCRVDHDGRVKGVAFSPDGTLVATASEDSTARVFEAATGSELSRVDHDNAVNAVAFSPDGTMVATASTDRSARVFEATPAMLVRRAADVMSRPLNPAELRRYILRPDCLHVEEWNLKQNSRRH